MATYTDGYDGDVNSAIDTYLAEGSQNNNYGTGTTIVFVSSAGSRRHGLFRFNLSALPSDATVNSATLYLYNANTWAAARNYAVYAILAANSTWTETAATWRRCVYVVADDTQSTSWEGDSAEDGGTDAGCSVSGTDYNATAMGTFQSDAASAGTEHAISLSTSQVENWLGVTNPGIIIMVTDASVSANEPWATSDHATTGYRPKLVVDYTEASTGVSGSLAVTLGAVTVSGAGNIPVTGSASVTLGAFTVAGAGNVAITGSLTATLGAVTLAGTGNVPITGSLSATLGAVTVAGSGVVGSTPITGSLSVTLGAVTASATGKVAVTGSLTQTLGAVTLTGAGVVPITGSLSSTLGAVSLAGAGDVAITGSANITLGAVTVSGVGNVPIVGSLAQTLGALTVSAQGGVNTVITGSLSVALGAVTLSATGSVYYIMPGSVTVTDAQLYAVVISDQQLYNITVQDAIRDTIILTDQQRDMALVTDAQLYTVEVAHG